MILKLIYRIYREDDDQPGQIYNKLYGLLSIFYTNPCYLLDSVSINISFVKDDKRHYAFLLKTTMQSEEDIRNIVYHIMDICKSKGLDLKGIDRLFVRISLKKIQD